MAAVIRVKRRIDEEPLNAFVLNCKRRKLEEEDGNRDSADETSTILKFAGTVNSQDDFMKVTKEKAERIITKVRNPNLTVKSREDVKQNTQSSRFKIVNCSRPIDFTQEVGKNITVVDIEKQVSDEEEDTFADETSESQQPSSSRTAAASNVASSSRKRSISNADANYVYDVYVPDGGTESNIDDNLIENLLSVQPFDLVYDHRGNDDANDSNDEYSEDSNSENNWRNDYPDSDYSVDEDDMRKAVEKMGLDDDDDDDENANYLSSSDDDEEHYRNGFVYSIDSENIGFEDDIDYCDVNRYGEAYARYKARVIKKTLRDDSNEEISDLDEYYDSS